MVELSAKSADCVVRRNSISIRFRHDDDESASFRSVEDSRASLSTTSGLESYFSENSYFVSVASGSSRSDGLRSSGLVSLGSSSSIEGRAASAFFQVASGTSENGAESKEKGDIPEHLRASPGNQQESLGRSNQGEREQASGTFMSMVRDESDDIMRGAKSFAGLDTGFWSAMAPRRPIITLDDDAHVSLGRSDGSSNASSNVSSCSSSGSSSGSSESDDSGEYSVRRLRRELHNRKSAKLASGFIALAVLTMSLVYLIAHRNGLARKKGEGKMLRSQSRALPQEFEDFVNSATFMTPKQKDEWSQHIRSFSEQQEARRHTGGGGGRVWKQRAVRKEARERAARNGPQKRAALTKAREHAVQERAQKRILLQEGEK